MATRLPWRKPKVRSWCYQALALLLVGGGIGFLAYNVSVNLPKSNIEVGFDFLSLPTRFEIGPNYFGVGAQDPVWMTFLVAIINTVRVSLLGIVLTAILGTLIALARLSKNWLVAKLSWIYVETVRNIPLLLQMLFWYALSTTFPIPKEAWNPFSSVFITNRGVYYPSLADSANPWWAILAFLLGLIAALWIARKGRAYRERTAKSLPLGWLMIIVIVLPSLLILSFADTPFLVEHPYLKGFNFRDGSVITPEFVAILTALTVYQSGFAAETIRSGILGVRKGQIEAARSLGLKPQQILFLVTMPQAMRIVVPPMASQFLSLTKNSSLAVAIGYAEVIRVSTAVISEYGRAIESIAIVMAIYLTLSLLTAAFMNWYNRRIAFVER